jgi:hypothetical protein
VSPVTVRKRILAMIEEQADAGPERAASCSSSTA